jgi:Ni/Co efflux regulator RcnB
MTSRSLTLVFAALMASSVAGGGAALADSHHASPLVAKSDKAKGSGNGNGHQDHGGDHGPAQKPDGAGSGNGHGNDTGADEGKAHARFADNDRDAIKHYYEQERAAGNCPPGLAKKNNGCLPPGQAKKAWSTGSALPSDYQYYDLPGSLYGQLQPLPVGYRYVQVDGDILLIELTSRVIYDVIVLY